MILAGCSAPASSFSRVTPSSAPAQAAAQPQISPTAATGDQIARPTNAQSPEIPTSPITPLPVDGSPQPSGSPSPPPLFTQAAGLPALPSKLPYATAYVVQPGPGARITSPFTLQASAIPGTDRSVLVQLIGEDGREILFEKQYFSTPQGQRVGLVTTLSFQIASVAEAARLQVSTRDAQGRLAALASSDVVLLASGPDEKSATPDDREPFYLTSPTANAVASGGILPIRGYIRPVNHQPVIFELLDDRGVSLGSASFTPPADISTYQPIAADLAYSIAAPAWARLTIRQPDVRLPGDAVLSSLLVLLNP
jgi:hypothetical protein